ncbi:type II secretion system protein [Candidatus Woesebacteria bacterium]|nr:type II secretion system protein [Candidatus Woesebacteria bacterium]
MKYRNIKGFTITELIIVMAVFSILFTFATINILGVKTRSALNSATTNLVTELKSQQLKATTGETEGTGTRQNYGVYFEVNQYTLFRGSTYVAGSLSNFVVSLPDQIEFSNILLPSSSMVFAVGSGQVSGFVPGSNSLTLKDTSSGTTKTLSINELGVITNVN